MLLPGLLEDSMPRFARIRDRRGLTLVELVVSLVIIGILLSLLLVAVQGTRESARKVTCVGNLRQIGLGVANYVSTHNAFPPGGLENGYSAHVRILPFVDLPTIHDLIDYSHDLDENSESLRFGTPAVYCCPSEPVVENLWGVNTQTSYVGVFGGGPENRQSGLLVTVTDGRFIRPSHVTDGLSNTLLFVETASFGLGTADDISGVPLRSRSFNMPRHYYLPDDVEQFRADCNDLSIGTQTHLSLGGQWLPSSTGLTRMSCIFPNLPRNCMNLGSTVRALYTPSSVHPGAFTVVLADGAVRRFSESIDIQIWQGLGTRDGGEIVTVPD
jgi:prepilin-type N-terminal cleavage/methylation domain-containing protein